MPTYDYECKACGHTFDVFQNMSDDPLSVCPACTKKQLRRLIAGGVGIIFKGSGFYVNDSRSKSRSATATAAKSETDGSSTDSKGGESKAAEPAAKTDSAAGNGNGDNGSGGNGKSGKSGKSETGSGASNTHKSAAAAK